MRIDFNVTGHEQIASRLQELSQKVRRQVLLRALERGGLPILKAMEQNAPFDPESGGPHLKHSMVMVPLRAQDGVRMGDHEAAIGIGPMKGIRHKGFQEFGTGLNAPQPYIRPAWDAEGGTKAQRLVGDELWTAIRNTK